MRAWEGGWVGRVRYWHSLALRNEHEHECGARIGSLVAWQCIFEDDGAVYKDEAKLNMHRRISISNTIQKYRLIPPFVGMKSVKRAKILQ